MHPQIVVLQRMISSQLIHHFKEPMMQRHWTNLFGALKQAELNAWKSNGAYSEVANPLDYLVEMFNDYENFVSQNQMVQYVPSGPTSPPIKKQPYQASASEWTYLANYTHDLEPTYLARKSILWGADWLRSTWCDCSKYLHQMFLPYHCSGQNDSDKD